MNKFKFLAHTLACVIAFGSCASAYNVYNINITIGDAPNDAKRPQLVITGTKKGAKDFTLPFTYKKNTSPSFVFDADSIRMIKSDSACKPENFGNLPKNINLSLSYKAGHWECAIK